MCEPDKMGPYGDIDPILAGPLTRMAMDERDRGTVTISIDTALIAESIISNWIQRTGDHSLCELGALHELRVTLDGAPGVSKKEETHDS